MTQAFDMMNPIGGVQEFPGKADEPWLPSDAAGLDIWLETLHVKGIGHNDKIASWPDNPEWSGAANDFVQSDEDRKPKVQQHIFGTNVFGFLFDSTDPNPDHLVETSLQGTAGTTHTWFFVIDATDSGGADEFLFSCDNGDWGLMQRRDTTNTGVYDGTDEYSLGVSKETAGILVFQVDGTSIGTRWNGSGLGGPETVLAMTCSGTGIIGTWAGGDVETPAFEGYIGAVLKYGVGGGPYIAQVESYLAERYNVTLS